MGRVSDKVAIVTGGASGIGEACSRLLAQEGAAVIVADIDEKGGTKTAGAIHSLGGVALYAKHDVTQEESWGQVTELAIKKFGHLDILVNCAGVAYAKPFEEISLQEWRWLMSVNLDGVFLGNRYGVGVMKNSASASIINMSSVNGIVSNPLVAAYSASKGAVRLLTKSVALYCADRRYPIRVNSVHPGYVATPMTLYRTQEQLEKLAGLHPIGHLGETLDVAYAVLYLASEESKFMTGSELVIDGGFSAQ